MDPKYIEIVSGTSWIAAYVLVLHRGIRDKTYGIPVLALTANIAWELLYGILFPKLFNPAITAIWLFLDLLILFQTVRFFKREIPQLSSTAFVLAVCAGIGLFLGIFYYAQQEGFSYISSAFPQNLMMSILFVCMAYERKDARGQSMYIGMLKMFGTAGPMWLVEPEPVFVLTFVAILCFDLLYLVLLHAQLRRLGCNPWTRI